METVPIKNPDTVRTNQNVCINLNKDHLAILYYKVCYFPPFSYGKSEL